MTVNDWVILITALGGIEGIKQFLKWWMSRRTNARIEDAHADVEEFKALREYNVGICYIGGLDACGKAKDTRTEAQKRALRVLVAKLVKEYPIKEILGHRDTSPDTDGDGIVEPHEWTKMCPCFDAKEEYKDLLVWR